MGKPKQSTKPSQDKQKQKSKVAAPLTAEEFQQCADQEEDAGGKWRAGDPAKSARAFLRALDFYDQGLKKHPQDFDLAYNKARLELEISQNPSVAAKTGLPLEALLRQCLESHRVAMGLDGGNVDVRFNAGQVLMSLGEGVVGVGGEAEEANLYLQEAVGLLEGVLGRQEGMLGEGMSGGEEEKEGDGGVKLDGSGSASVGQAGSSAEGGEEEEQSATIVQATTPNDLLDTLQALLSALTTLTSLVDPEALGQLGKMAQTLTESKAPSYIGLLPADAQDKARFAVGLARATFVAAFADAQYSAQVVGLQEYISRLQAFDLPGKENDAPALTAEAQARSEMVLSALEQADQAGGFAAEPCWKQLTLAQEVLTKATKLTTEEAKERKPTIYANKGDIELLRYRLATTPGIELSDAVRKSSPTLLTNARTFFKGAVDHGKVAGDEEVVEKGSARFALLNEVIRLSSQAGGSSSNAGSAATVTAGPKLGIEELMEVLEECVEEGLLDMRVAEDFAEKLQGA